MTPTVDRMDLIDIEPPPGVTWALFSNLEGGVQTPGAVVPDAA